MWNVVRALLVSLSLVVSPDHGPSPLTVTATVTVNGPYEGPVCLVVVDTEGDLQGGPFCANDDESVVVEDGKSDNFDFKLTGTVPGTYFLIGLIDTDNGQTAPVQVTIEN